MLIRAERLKIYGPLERQWNAFTEPSEVIEDAKFKVAGAVYKSRGPSWCPWGGWQSKADVLRACFKQERESRRNGRVTPHDVCHMLSTVLDQGQFSQPSDESCRLQRFWCCKNHIHTAALSISVTLSPKKKWHSICSVSISCKHLLLCVKNAVVSGDKTHAPAIS